MASGAGIVAVCVLGRNRGGYVTKTTNAVLRRRGHSNDDRNRLANWLRATLLYGLIFGLLMFVLGLTSVVVGIQH
jgi:hypothetical protein